MEALKTSRRPQGKVFTSLCFAFEDRNFFQQKLRSFLTVYLLLALSFLLIITLFAVSLSRVSAVSSKLNEVQPERRHNFSSRDSLLFPCGPGSREWEYFDGKCYYFSLARTSWHKAKAHCEEMHSQLAVINSYAKQNFVMFRTRNERFWIGLTDENSEGEWEWIDGTDYKTTFTFWKEGEPNNSGNNEDCAHVWVSGKWNDVYCTYECYYVCEKPLPN
ncbi:hepatic lectin, transcript variant X1 [Columba livia]|uniref:Hepatic lectin, transcript variant X1 n=1 Tax=Columba livia TaxID=8932 RepID=A0A2I0LLL6_COLLI|nr:hepatic lectin isoform X1 [Columba livia]PKK18320.1 hepatic lectin, transcript variant X1 [Columba livia]